MKKFRILLASAAILAVAGAFSTVKAVDPSNTYVLTDEGYVLESLAEGECVPSSGTHCKYLRDEQGQYTPIDQDRIWQPN